MNKPKILIFDIETQPTLAYVWQAWKQNISINQIAENGGLLMWAAKWYGSDTIIVETTQGRSTEKNCAKKLWKLLDEADVVVAHNAYNFDIKVMNGIFLKYGMSPPSKYHVIDTLRVARKQFRLFSNKLDYLGGYLKLGNKIENDGWKLWVGCLKNDSNSWEKMIEYNIRDVELLEDVYNKLKPWVQSSFNYAAYLELETEGCKNCGGTSLAKNGFDVRRGGIYQRYRCKDCGTNNYSRFKEKGVNKTVLA